MQNQKRSLVFTILLSITLAVTALLILIGVMNFIAFLGGRDTGSGIGVAELILGGSMFACTIGALKLKLWGAIGLVAISVLSGLYFLLSGQIVPLFFPLLGLLTVLSSVLTKDWDLME